MYTGNALAALRRQHSLCPFAPSQPPSHPWHFIFGTNLPSALRELAGSGKPEVVDFIFILHFNFIFNLPLQMSTFYYICFLPSHLITAHRNVIALWA